MEMVFVVTFLIGFALTLAGLAGIVAARLF